MLTAKSRPSHGAQQQGFTLIELLIASTIFAIMAVMAYGGLANVIDNSTGSKLALKRLQQVQQSISVLNRDLSQILPRDVRDEYGNKQPYLGTSNNIDYLIEFTRGGRVNPANLLRSTLLRIAYQLKDEKLLRLQWPQLDNAPGVELKETVLLDEVSNVSLRFIDENAETHEQWPPLNAGSTNTGTTGTVALRAIEIVIQLNDWGEIRRLYAMQ